MADAALTRVGPLLAAGATQTEVRHLTAPLTRLAKGVYGDLRDLDAQRSHRLRMQAVLTRLSAVCVSHTSAALLWDLPTRQHDLDLVRVSPLSGRAGHAKAGTGYHVHCREVPPDRVALCDATTVTDPLRTVLDSATVLSGDWAVVVADAALHRGLIDSSELASAATATRRIKGARRVRMLPELCSGLAESPGETLLRLRLVRMGLAPLEQITLPAIEGRPRVDFLVDEQLVVEFDGRVKYGIEGDPERAHWEEKVRHDRLVEAGYEVLRITWSDLWDEPELSYRVNRAVRRAKRRRSA